MQPMLNQLRHLGFLCLLHEVQPTTLRLLQSQLRHELKNQHASQHWSAYGAPLQRLFPATHQIRQSLLCFYGQLQSSLQQTDTTLILDTRGRIQHLKFAQFQQRQTGSSQPPFGNRGLPQHDQGAEHSIRLRS